MARRCTAPVNGHRTASGAEACPACRGGSSRYTGYSDYGSRSYTSYTPSSGSGSGSSGSGSSGSSGRTAKPKWSKAGSSVVYTPAEVQTLTPYRETVETRPPQPDRRDVFLCHAWADRNGAAKELYELLVSRKVSEPPATLTDLIVWINRC